MIKKTIRFFSMALGCMLLSTVALVSVQPGTPPASALNGWETRCGWFSNPTPANASLYDKDGEWTIGVQGGYQAEGDWPSFKRRQWVTTNDGSYGYGCACLRLRVDHETHKVLEIKSSHTRPLAECRKDRSLKEPK